MSLPPYTKKIFIAHRGSFRGLDANRENSRELIEEALNAGLKRKKKKKKAMKMKTENGPI